MDKPINGIRQPSQIHLFPPLRLMDDSLFYYYPLPKKSPILPSGGCKGNTIINKIIATTSTAAAAAAAADACKEEDFLFYYYPFPKNKIHISPPHNRPPPPSRKVANKKNNLKSITKMDYHVPLTAITCTDTLRVIFQKLQAQDLARACCVCKLWRGMASDGEIVKSAFMEPWKLKEIVGKPMSGSFWRESGIWKFAISHKIVRGDSVASLAVKYSVQVMDILRLNNMMSDHGIYSRERLLIPIRNPDLLINGTCYIELDTYARREVAVLYPEGKPDEKLSPLSKGSLAGHTKRRVIESLKRSMQVDDGTAEYYWSSSKGDPRAAFTEFSADLRWEREAGLA